MQAVLAIGETMVLVTPEQPESLETATGFRLEIACAESNVASHLARAAFPASSLGPGLISAMRGPFPDTRFVATGGLNVTNARDFLAAGARAVSLGSALADPGQLDALSRLVTRRP